MGINQASKQLPADTQQRTISQVGWEGCLGRDKQQPVTAGDTIQNPVGKIPKTMPQLSQLSPVAANLRREFPAHLCLTVKMKRALEAVSIRHLGSPVLHGLGKDTTSCWPVWESRYCPFKKTRVKPWYIFAPAEKEMGQGRENMSLPSSPWEQELGFLGEGCYTSTWTQMRKR